MFLFSFPCILKIADESWIPIIFNIFNFSNFLALPKVWILDTVIVNKVYNRIEAFVSERKRFFNRYEFSVIRNKHGIDRNKSLLFYS